MNDDRPSDHAPQHDDDPQLLYVEAGVSLASMTTLEVGGPARVLVCCEHADQVIEALEWCRDGNMECVVIGGGSNILASDDGFDGMVLQLTNQNIDPHIDGDRVRLRADAGASWDDVVALAAAEGWAGIECLSGIPGSVGAAPIQNIGAYGQELSETLVAVEVLDRSTRKVFEMPASKLGLGYRKSRFKSAWQGRFIVLRVILELTKGGSGTVRYADLGQRLGLGQPNGAGERGALSSLQSSLQPSPQPSPQAVRDAVLEVRREKSMVWDPEDPNHRSAGSFFMNPVVNEAEATLVAERANKFGVTRKLPRYGATLVDGSAGVKLSAAWLIEEAGFSRGHVSGQAGLSSRHCLALINRGAARAADLVRLAAEIRHRVDEIFGVQLDPEPVLVGFDHPVSELLART